MNGSTLALGLTAALAAAGALSRRGGRGPAFGSRAKKGALSAREVFDLFQEQTDAGESYFDLFSPWSQWSLVSIDPRLIQSYTEPGAIQNGFSDAEDEAAARRYASMGIENAPPIFVRPHSGPPYAWLHMDGQTRARAAFLSGKPVLGYAPIGSGQ